MRSKSIEKRVLVLVIPLLANQDLTPMLAHTGTERFRINLILCSDRNITVPLACFPFACSDGNGTERMCIVQRFASLFSRSIFWKRTVLFEAFPSKRNPSAFQFSNQYGTK